MLVSTFKNMIDIRGGNIVSLDFSYNKYSDICKTISESDYDTLLMRDFFNGARSDRFLILRHDIDYTIYPAYDLAKLEYDHGIKSTYYVRYTKKVLNYNLIKKIEDMGHEIGYHYETMDKARGDYAVAIKTFEQELDDMRKYCRIATIAMHGNPLSRLDNRDLWKKYNFRAFGILGEAYLSVNFNELTYLSDSGRSWDVKYKVHDTICQDHPRVSVKNTDRLMDLIKSGHIDKLYVLTHPIHWSKSKPLWYREYIRQNVFKMGKILIKKVRNNNVN